MKVRDRWRDVAYLPMRITNPATKCSVYANVKVDLDTDLGGCGILALISHDIIKTLELPKGELFEVFDQDITEWYRFKRIKVEMSLREHTVTGWVDVRGVLETRLLSDFLSTVPDNFDVQPFKGIQVRENVIVPPKSIFLSHSHKDRQFTRYLARFLQGRGIGVWLDEAEIRAGESLIEKLRSAIDAAECVIAILSKSSIQSSWVQRELDIAMNQEIANRRIKVIPLLKDDCELPGFLKGKLYADFRIPHHRRKAREKLIDSILTLLCDSLT